MNNKFRKASAVITAIFLLASMSACSAQSLGLKDAAIGKDQDPAANTNALGEGGIEEDDIESVETIYNRGIELLKNGKYAEAQAEFAKCGDYGNVKDLITVCKAENEFSKGNYNAAKSYYSAVSDTAETPGFPIQARKANIETRITLEQMTGNYYPSYNRISMDKYKKKKVVGWWRNVGTWGQQYLTISYNENEDGTFNVTGEVQFMRYTKYAKKESGIKKGTYKLPIDLKNISQFPEKITLAKGVTLTYQHSVFQLNYSKTDNNKKKKTKVVYKSQVTYKKS
jgi:tetratricopeptide (TPR) repeat protein